MFAVVILGGIGNLLGTLVAGVGIGVLSGLVSVIWSPSTEPFVLFLGDHPGPAPAPAGPVRPGRHGVSARTGVAGLLAVAVVLGVIGRASDSIGLPASDVLLAATVLFWVTQATSWNLLSGFAGYFSFGQGAYIALGAYSTAVFYGRNGGNFFLAILIGGLLGGALAVVVGAVAFRLRSLRGEIFALLTLALPFILAAFARITGSIDGGQGTTIRLPHVPAWMGSFAHVLFLLNLVLAALAVGVALVIYHTRLGHGLSAIQDAEAAAEVLGVPTFRYKMVAIVLGGVLGGLGGAVFGLQIGFVAVESVFALILPLTVIVICVLGGRRHWLGPVVGALLIVVLQDRLTAGGLEQWSAIVLGGLLAVLVVIAPDGLLGRLRARWLLALVVFLVVMVGMTLTGYWDPIDALLYGMLAAVGVATLVDLLRPRKPAVAVAPAVPALHEPIATPPPATDGPLVVCDGVTRYFGGVKALEDVSFQVGDGEIVGLVGPNGSGKTTLVNLLSGAMAPTRGRIEIGGHPINRLAAHRVAHAGVARTYQIPKPFRLDDGAGQRRHGGHVRPHVGIAADRARGGRAAPRDGPARTPGRRPARRPQPAPAAVAGDGPGDRRRTDRAAPRRGPGRAQPGRDRRRGRGDPQYPRERHLDHHRRAPPARAEPARHPDRGAQPGHADRRRRPGHGARPAGRGPGVPGEAACLRSAGSTPATATPRRCGTSASTSPPPRRSASSGPTGPVRPPWSTPSPGCTGRQPAASASTGSTFRRCPGTRCATYGVATVPEGRRVFGHMTVRDNLLLGAYRKAARAVYRETEQDVYRLFPRLAERAGQAAGSLSGGEQQMVAIGRALMARPRLLLLDEPSLGLAPVVVDEVFDALQQITRTGVAVLLVEQDVERALAAADRGYLLIEGRIVASGTAAALRETNEVRQRVLGL